MGPRLFHALLQRASAAPESDAELLRRFAATRDEPAFAELVRRYGGLVWGQCRNLLPNEADAEDAFQATFLALAQRPGAVRAAVGPYLHGVAYRVCLNARRVAGRRKRREVAAATSEAERPVADSAWDAALAAVHAELHRLPDPQRVAFVLCVLEGRGLTDAAAHLGVKLGTLSARLSRAKQALMDRLAAKGVLAGMAAVAALAPAGVTAALVEKAVQSAVGAAVVPDVVLSLTHGVTTMATKFKLLAAAVLLACGLGLGVGSGWVATAQDKPKDEAPKPYLLPQAEAKYHDLRLKLLQAQAELEQARLEAQGGEAKPVAVKPEFKYVPLTGDGVMSAKDFEKVVAENETDGYTFVGSVPLAGRKFLNKIAEEAFPTLVFRKKPAAEKPTTAKDLQDYQQRLWFRYNELKQAELPLKEQWGPLAAQKAQLEAQAEKLRAEIKVLEAAMAAKTPAAKPEQATATVDLGPKAAELSKAILALADKKFAGRKDALRLIVSGTAMDIRGDADAVKWVAALIDGL